MQSLIQTTQRVLASNGSVPFAVIHSVKEQHIVNVPILKPLLICILDGVKQLGIEAPLQCTPGSFVFLSNHPNINMRNLPRKHHYFALLVEFEDSDFDCVPSHPGPTVPYVNGRIDSTLQKTLSQFVEWSAFAPSSLWPLRRQELLLTLYHLGHREISQLRGTPSISHQLHALLSQDIAANIGSAQLAQKLAMSESTLRRKLAQAGLSLQGIRESIRLGHGLGLLQTSNLPISQVAEQCGYTSQSRFTEKFKQRFGLTPTELRKTLLQD